jgi:hypothetical protein
MKSHSLYVFTLYVFPFMSFYVFTFMSLRLHFGGMTTATRASRAVRSGHPRNLRPGEARRKRRLREVPCTASIVDVTRAQNKPDRIAQGDKRDATTARG